MEDTKTTILIVDNDPSVCFSLSQVFRALGHGVCSSEDGFEALREMGVRQPDILISDLNMPEMSGFELLSITRRRFPKIFAIGMTGAFIDRLPEGIAADAFYRKASGLPKLFDLIKTASVADMNMVRATRSVAPIWVPPIENECCDGKRVYIGCPECLRAFPQEPIAEGALLETRCAHCRAPINYAVVEQFA